MARNDCSNQHPVHPDAMESEIAKIRSLNADELRSLWLSTFNRASPPTFTKDLLARMLAWHIQERAFGGFDRMALKVLESYTRAHPAESDRVRRLKPGTEIVREYQRERHTVTVAREGYIWRGTTYKSLTTIARAITGTNWNGPRFFGLRDGDGNVRVRAGSVPAQSRSRKPTAEATL